MSTSTFLQKQRQIVSIGNQLQGHVRIQGTRPLLWNHLKPSESFGRRQQRRGNAGNDPTEWQRNVLMTPQRQLYLLPSHIFGCLRDAAKYTKRNQNSLVNDVVSTLRVLEQQVLINRFVPEHPVKTSEEVNDDVYIFMSIVRNSFTRNRNLRYRVAASPGWQCQFTLIWDRTIISRNEMQAIAIDAGNLVGLADGRSIGYGRFCIVDFAVREL